MPRPVHLYATAVYRYIDCNFQIQITLSNRGPHSCRRRNSPTSSCCTSWSPWSRRMSTATSVSP
ncbi:hypothetical protein D2F00_09210, partial [Mycobacteroides abscessus]